MLYACRANKAQSKNMPQQITLSIAVRTAVACEVCWEIKVAAWTNVE
jgi:hypothetical protein